MRTQKTSAFGAEVGLVEWAEEDWADGIRRHGLDDLCELGFDAAEGEGFEGFVFELLDDVGGEALRDHAAGASGVDATTTEVVDLFVTDAGGGAAVGALDLVSVDFEAGHGVGLGFVAHEEVAAGLVGISVMCRFIHEDEAREDGLSFAKQGVLEEEVTASVGSAVVLEGALVVFLTGVGNGDGENLGIALGTGDGGVGFLPSPSGTDVNGASLGAGVFAELGVGEADEVALGVEFLRDEVTQFAIVHRDEVADGDHGSGIAVGGADESFEDGGPRARHSDNENVGKGSDVFTRNEVNDLDGLFASAADVNGKSTFTLGAVEGS